MRVNFNLLNEMLVTGNNVVLPIVGAKIAGVEQYIVSAKQSGYSVYLHLNELPNEKAVGRMLQRYFETGRFINPGFVMALGNGPTEVYEQLIERSEIDGYSRWNNDVPRGQGAICEDYSESERIYVRSNGARGRSARGGGEKVYRGDEGKETAGTGNYSPVTNSLEKSTSVREEMAQAWGAGAEAYIKNLLRSIEGELKGTDGARLINKAVLSGI